MTRLPSARRTAMTLLVVTIVSFGLGCGPTDLYAVNDEYARRMNERAWHIVREPKTPVPQASPAIAEEPPPAATPPGPVEAEIKPH
jgi:hypothetical protein